MSPPISPTCYANNDMLLYHISKTLNPSCGEGDLSEDSQTKGIWTLLVEARAEGGGGPGGGDVEQREHWEDLSGTQPEMENDLNQTNRSARGVYVGVVLRVQSKL